MLEETTESSSDPDPDPPSDPPPNPPGTPPDAPQPELGDFDDRAAEFWSVYVKEAQRHDEALIGTWKEDMEGVIIFAGLYSATLTAFIVESRKKLTLDPSDEIVYYARQSVTLLAQISAQLAASGSPVPSTFVLPPAFPDFRVAQSDVRVNIYWFMSLVFSLSAALMATLVQQWVREYVHIFQRYNHPFKCARIRQFLHEGADRWKMDVVVNLVPALIHVSLFLFFVGLADSLFKINTATAVTTTTLIVICALCYLLSVIAPIWNAQSPYQSPLSGLFWASWHVLFHLKYKDHITGESLPISANMTDGRVQLAMAADDSGRRKDRDAHAIEWIVDDLTEDSELEPLVRSIPDSFNSRWGKAVWYVVLDREMHGSDVVSRLNNRITRLLGTCIDPGAFPDETERERRAHACLGASLSLVLYVEYKWAWLEECATMAQVLIYLINVTKTSDTQIRDVPVLQAAGAGKLRSTLELDSTSSIRWTCMSMIVVRRMLMTSQVRDAAKQVINCLAGVSGERDGSNDEKAAKTAGTINKHLKAGWDSADSLREELIPRLEVVELEDRLREIVREKQDDITQLDNTWNVFGWTEKTDEAILKLAQTLKEATSSVLYNLPGAVLQWEDDPRPSPEKGTQSAPSYFMPHFIPPRQLLRRLWLCVWTIRRISTTGWGASKDFPETLADLSAPELSMPTIRKLMGERQAPMETQLWRLQDLRSGGLVYTLELFIEAIKSSGKSAMRESSQELYGDTFDFFTRKRDGYEFSVWTEQLLVDLLQRVLPANGGSPSDQVPEYIIDRFLTFLVSVLENRKRSHVKAPISRTEGHRERPDGYQCSVWTERVLVDLLQRVLPSAEGGPSSGQLSQNVIDHFLTLIADVLAKKEGPHVYSAILQIKAYCARPDNSSEAAKEALSKLERVGT